MVAGAKGECVAGVRLEARPVGHVGVAADGECLAISEEVGQDVEEELQTFGGSAPGGGSTSAWGTWARSSVIVPAPGQISPRRAPSPWDQPRTTTPVRARTAERK